MILNGCQCVSLMLLNSLARHSQIFSEDISLILMVLAVFGTVLADLRIFFYLEGFLMDVVGEFFFLASFGTGADVTHFSN